MKPKRRYPPKIDGDMWAAKNLIPDDVVSFRLNGEDCLATVAKVESWHDHVLIHFSYWDNPIRFERNHQFWVLD